jgi:hypothetical protein
MVSSSPARRGGPVHSVRAAARTVHLPLTMIFGFGADSSGDQAGKPAQSGDSGVTEGGIGQGVKGRRDGRRRAEDGSMTTFTLSPAQRNEVRAAARRAAGTPLAELPVGWTGSSLAPACSLSTVSPTRCRAQPFRDTQTAAGPRCPPPINVLPGQRRERRVPMQPLFVARLTSPALSQRPGRRHLVLVRTLRERSARHATAPVRTKSWNPVST